ncbi:hypothetical protein F4778DRAFT_716781 [Xylariomycetidae sp. FL2044]|nr:hypothetical protein F4778DRAFT_716781 [Xylariomycetidae sp. FL2044]
MEHIAQDTNHNLLCLDCQQPRRKLAYCSVCRDFYCDECWPRQLLHRPGRAVSGEHEQVKLDLYQRLWDTFNPDPRRQDELHREDEETTWFAVERDSVENQQKIIYDSGRYASLVANGSEGRHLLRFPAIVSFVGQTGAGKSTLLKMLIERQFAFLARDAREAASYEKMFPRPVVGSFEHSNVPTSGDVHIYGDPSTFWEESPTYFVDSEGLEGGEATPMATRHKQQQDAVLERRTARSSKSRPRIKKAKLLRFSREVSRPIHWATSPERDKREFAVTHFYPRILYTFSDVIVFVLRNPRTFQSAVALRLIEWAAEVLNASTNQPRLPHAIIVLNAADARTQPSQWDIEHATESLLNTVKDTEVSKEESKRVSELMRHWDMPEKPVRTVRDLLLCYYSSVRVVYVPDHEQYLRMDGQVEKLHAEIRAACADSQNTKKQARMRMNADELDELFQKAFEHFSKSLDSPFDLVEAARKDAAIPRDFGGNITKLAVTIRDNMERVRPGDADGGKEETREKGVGKIEGHQTSVRDIFRPLGLMVASCILLECSRGNWKGSATELFRKNYELPCRKALYAFYQQFWPCEYQFDDGRGRCLNTLERHQKGHQVRGKQRPGAYMASCSFKDCLTEWLRIIYDWILRFEYWLKRKNTRETREEDIVAQIHQFNIHRFYEEVHGSLMYVSHSFCLCCLREMPENPLPCGHILCTPCMMTYGTLQLRLAGDEIKERGKIQLARCPLHSLGRKGFKATEPQTISLKPDMAGIRLLCLDGGGIRGIVELEVLKQIELYLGGRIPIRSFFDLIVGTSTGGIIAAGIGVEGWSVSQCMKHFMDVADKAFTRRRFGFHDFPGLGRVGRKYRTQPFEEALQDLFGKDEYLFGGFQADPERYKTRVALTSTTATGSTAVVLANYNRPDDSPFTEFIRPDKTDHELKTWEAIRATTAAPGFFRGFTKPETGQSFVDGAVYHNNPAYVAFEESRLLWPDVSHCLPDIILSIGTGHNLRSTTRELGRARERQSSQSIRPPEIQAVSERVILPTGSSEKGLRRRYEVIQNIKLIMARMHNVLNSQLIWDTFRRERILSTPRHEIETVKKRFQRIDPFLGFDPPRLDEKAKMKLLKDTTSRTLEKDRYYRRKIRFVARQLVASSFYFEKSRHDSLGAGHYQYDGRIFCKFQNNTDELSHLGEFLLSKKALSMAGRGPSYPHFRVQEIGRPGKDMEITENVLSRMVKGWLSIFDFDMIYHRVSSRNAEVIISLVFWDDELQRPDLIPISGFPRKIVAENIQVAETNRMLPTPTVVAAEYWHDMNSEMPDRSELDMRDWISTDDDKYAADALGPMLVEPEPDVPRPDSPIIRRTLFSGVDLGWGINRLFPALNLRTNSRSPKPSSSEEESEKVSTRAADAAAKILRDEIGTKRSHAPSSFEKGDELLTSSDEDEAGFDIAIRQRLGGVGGELDPGESVFVGLQRALALSLLEGGDDPKSHFSDDDDDDDDDEEDEDEDSDGDDKSEGR